MNRKNNNTPRQFLKILIWSFIAAALVVLTLLPVSQALLSWDDGFAQAQTGPPPKDDDDDDGVPPLPETPTAVPGPDGPVACPPNLPPGLQIVDHLFLDGPPSNIPSVPPGEGNYLARVPAAPPPDPALATLPVPSGVITEPVAILPIRLLPQFYCSLIVPTEPLTDVIVRVEVLTPDQAPISVFEPDVIPSDWYLVPHPEVPELGYGAPTPIEAPGVTASNYVKYAQKVGLPTSPIPPPDASAAGVIPTLPWQGQALTVEAVFKLDLYRADTGEEISIHLPELVLITCGEFERNLLLLRANQTAGRYDMPVQNLNLVPLGDYRDRLKGYLLETSTFVIARVSGQVPPPLVSGRQAQEAGSAIVMPAGLPRTGAQTTPDAAIPWTVPIAGGGLIIILGLALYLYRSPAK